MADIRLIVTDLDGSFLVNHNDAHLENVRAIRHAQESGIMVCACTKRSWTMCRYVIKRYGFNPYTITSGGAAIIDNQTEEPLFLKTIQPTALLPLLYVAWQSGIDTMQVCCSDECAAFGEAVKERLLQTRVRNAAVAADQKENIRVYRSFLDFFYSVETRGELVSLFTREDSGLLPAKLSEILEDLDAFDLFAAADGTVDAIRRGCDKADALQRLCRTLNIERENVLAIGSEAADISMLYWAGVGVAMGQADDMVKRAADVVTVDNRDAGVAKAIYEIAMGYGFD